VDKEKRLSKDSLFSLSEWAKTTPYPNQKTAKKANSKENIRVALRKTLENAMIVQRVSAKSVPGECHIKFQPGRKRRR
jgi:hypothetical protein